MGLLQRTLAGPSVFFALQCLLFSAILFQRCGKPPGATRSRSGNKATRRSNSALGRCWQFGGAQFGWGLLITSVLFAGANGLVRVDSQLHARIVLPAAIAPFMLGVVSGWVRERTNSIWPSVFGHNISNIVIPAATLVSRSFH